MADPVQQVRGLLNPDPNADYGQVLPFARDRTTGEKRLAMPDMIRSGLLGATDLMGGLDTGKLTPEALQTFIGGLLGGGMMAARGALGTAARPYANVPDSLMGFPRQGYTKPFEEQGFKHVQNVAVKFPDSPEFVDAVKGLNQPHALERARRNWDGAEVRPVTFDEAVKIDPSYKSYGDAP